MNQHSGCGLPNVAGAGRLWTAVWKRAVLAIVAVAMVIGFAACSLDDLLMPIGGDIPFEQETTTPPEMGAVDNIPTVPEDPGCDDVDFRPFS
jgi:hypothetical protein